VTPIALPIPLTYEGIFWSPDERRIYYRALDGAVREREVATGNERIVLDERGGDRIGPISVSPDGRWIATYRSDAVLLLPIDGGEPRELHRFARRVLNNKPITINNNPMPWMPDGRAVLVWLTPMDPTDPACGTGHACQTELWQVPTDGGTARKLAVTLDGAIDGQLGKIRLSPDGRQLAYVAGRSYQRETWVLENFLPPTR
jgi:Tol biopolymer transport system component